MVVSIEISGPYEERLRRLVELGVYASVAEAVRDAIRKLMNEIDMKKIGLNLYIRKGSSLMYYCELAGEPCASIIEYMLVNDVAPRLGAEASEDLEAPPVGSLLLFDPSSLLVTYTTLAWKALEKLAGSYRLAILESIEPFERVYFSLAARRGMNPKLEFETIKAKVKNPPSRLLLTQDEYTLIQYASGSNGVVLVIDDTYVRRIARQSGAQTTTSIALVLEAARKGLLSRIEVEDIVYSLRLLPYLYPREHVEGVVKS